MYEEVKYMKKVAIMTWYSYENYGSKLQATAMLENIKNRGMSPTFINYIPRGIIKDSYNESLVKKLLN